MEKERHYGKYLTYNSPIFKFLKAVIKNPMFSYELAKIIHPSSISYSYQTLRKLGFSINRTRVPCGGGKGGSSKVRLKIPAKNQLYYFDCQRKEAMRRMDSIVKGGMKNETIARLGPAIMDGEYTRSEGMRDKGKGNWREKDA